MVATPARTCRRERRSCPAELVDDAARAPVVLAAAAEAAVPANHDSVARDADASGNNAAVRAHNRTLCYLHLLYRQEVAVQAYALRVYSSLLRRPDYFCFDSIHLKQILCVAAFAFKRNTSQNARIGALCTCACTVCRMELPPRHNIKLN